MLQTILPLLKKTLLLLLVSLSSSLAAQDQVSVNPWVIVPDHTLYLRAEPSSKSPITDTIKQFSKPEKLIYLYPEQGSEWIKIAHYVETKRYDENGFYLGSQKVIQDRYINRKELTENAGAIIRVKPGKKIPAKFDDRPYSEYKDNLTEDSGALYVLYRRSGNIIELRLSNGKARCVSAESLHNNTLLENISISTVVGEINLDHRAKIKQIQHKLRIDYSDPLEAKTRAPLAVIVLMGLIIVSSLVFSSNQSLSLSIRYALLISTFIIELLYLIVFGYDFWFCSPYEVGWIKAGLWCLVGIVVIFLQYVFLFHIIDKIKSSAKDFNTRTSMLSFLVISVAMVIYAMIKGGTNATEDLVSILVLIGIQVAQMILIFIKLRTHPWKAFMAATLLPLGNFAILFSSLSIFNFLFIFAFLALLIGAWGNSKPSAHAQKESIKSSNRFYKARQCRFFSEGGGYKCSKKSAGCSLVQYGECDEYSS